MQNAFEISMKTCMRLHFNVFDFSDNEEIVLVFIGRRS